MGHDGLRLATFDESRLELQELMLGNHTVQMDWAINEPSCCTGFIEYDHETAAPYTFSHTEVHYAISGEAEYTYTSFPDHMEERTKIVKAGTVCLIKFGSAIKVRPIESPYRVLFVVMPMPEVPYQSFD